jgi:hypothetical protein
MKRRSVPAKDRWRSACITFDDPNRLQIHAAVFRGYAAPDSSNCLALHAFFDDVSALPRDNSRQLFNLLEALEYGIRLLIMPELPEGIGCTARDKSNPEIALLGVKTALPIERLTGPLLDEVFFRLLTSANTVQRILTGEEKPDDDAWGRLYEDDEAP